MQFLHPELKMDLFCLFKGVRSLIQTKIIKRRRITSKTMTLNNQKLGETNRKVYKVVLNMIISRSLNKYLMLKRYKFQMLNSNTVMTTCETLLYSSFAYNRPKNQYFVILVNRASISYSQFAKKYLHSYPLSYINKMVSLTLFRVYNQ